MRNKLSRLMVLGMLCLVPTMVLAHEGTGSPGGFASGFLHPVLGLDHLLVVLAVGIWGARIGGRAVWTLIVAFPLFAGAGGFLGMIGVPIPFVDIWIALSMVGFGLAIATGVPATRMGRAFVDRTDRAVARPHPRHGAAAGRPPSWLRDRFRPGHGASSSPASDWACSSGRRAAVGASRDLCARTSILSFHRCSPGHLAVPRIADDRQLA